MDLWIRDRYYYMPSPLSAGFFEFTMMRSRESIDAKKRAKLYSRNSDSKNTLNIYSSGTTENQPYRSHSPGQLNKRTPVNGLFEI